MEDGRERGREFETFAEEKVALRADNNFATGRLVNARKDRAEALLRVVYFTLRRGLSWKERSTYNLRMAAQPAAVEAYYSTD